MFTQKEGESGVFASNLCTQSILMRPHQTDRLKEVILMLCEVREITDFMQN